MGFFYFFKTCETCQLRLGTIAKNLGSDINTCTRFHSTCIGHGRNVSVDVGMYIDIEIIYLM